ncbi:MULTISPECIES: acetylxylan esterase [Streptococcus mitis group]|uniref:Acetyl xylan esterase domain-containing protein n=1 Tax=Streptococcus gwangjuensis TaxID=1433513 RepID=A0A387B526_9STRE|nr:MULTISPECIES: acetylxylan esterase [Streptococcus]AYF96106.1 hypothetical protein D7D53_06225 [Streptococcus gwangjuense]
MKNPALLEDIKTYKGRDEVPEDFDAFWDEEVKKVSTLPAYQLEERDFHISQVKCYELTFEGSKEGKVYARVVLPKSDEKVPIIFHFHGYMGRGLDDDVCYPITQFAIYNRLTCDKSYRIMPEYAHEAMNVFVNDQVYNWLCGSEISFKYIK